ncbi:hypothetical protein K466DRAFT_222173 [Polyporus arcularius HHB13444]|uniref:Uncharacterized protein n=1 Tax=Polyporus arcularius HHB13444 TaxID=1314778 RepID=A0A5C3PF51_9APHY|nr:hypothetical protein K466DRAFT_222173 [Polyporus arcularius HHB13444]
MVTAVTRPGMSSCGRFSRRYARQRPRGRRTRLCFSRLFAGCGACRAHSRCVATWQRGLAEVVFVGSLLARFSLAGENEQTQCGEPVLLDRGHPSGSNVRFDTGSCGDRSRFRDKYKVRAQPADHWHEEQDGTSWSVFDVQYQFIYSEALPSETVKVTTGGGQVYLPRLLARPERRYPCRGSWPEDLNLEFDCTSISWLSSLTRPVRTARRGKKACVGLS